MQLLIRSEAPVRCKREKGQPEAKEKKGSRKKKPDGQREKYIKRKTGEKK